jgi:Phage Terminase
VTARRARLPAPRWETPLPRSAVGSWGPLVVRFARLELGIELDRWQIRAITRALAVDDRGRLVHREYLVSTGRQSGKTALVRSLIGWALTNDAGPAWALIYGLAYNRPQARIPYAAVLADLAELARRVGPEARGGLALTRYLGIRSAMYGRRREYHVTSREARDAIRGYSIDLALFDEVRTQRDEETYAALKPTVSARPEPLIFEISSAGDERSVLLRSLWERGRRIIDRAEPAEGFGMTWYAAGDADAPDDPRAWAKATPAIAEGRIDPATIRDELRALTPATFRRERLNLWADAADEWLPPGVWARQIAPAPATVSGRVVLGVESEPGWSRATVAVAIAAPDAPVYVALAAELIAPSGSTVSPAELLEALERVRVAYGPALVVWSRAAAVARHLEAWALEHDVETLALTPTDLRKASELFRSELVGARLEHSDDPALAVQARRARPSGALEAGAWYFSVRESRGAIDGLRGAVWAAWGAISPEAEEPQAAIF